jgi:TonB family protein
VIDSAAPKNAGDPDASVDEADRILDGASARASEINLYWSQLNAVFWRERWKAFAETNGLSPDSTDPELASREQVVLGHLAKGDFPAAAAANADIETRLQAAIRTATADIMKKKNDADVKYYARNSPCPATDAPRSNASITQAASPADYYPPSSRRREETGDVVVRARVAATGCATAFAVMVGSGYPELDTAAIRVAEASRYAAAMDARGQPVDASVTFKVKFTIKP